MTLGSILATYEAYDNLLPTILAAIAFIGLIMVVAMLFTEVYSATLIIVAISFGSILLSFFSNILP